VTGEPPHLWGSIVGFGQYHYKYESGREGDAPAAGFAPRKAATVIYFSDGIARYEERLSAWGTLDRRRMPLHQGLEKVDLSVLEAMIAESYQTLTTGTYGSRAREG
jgi:hypothetical protein